ncbi:prevent-host-death protein [Chryseobacterium sp. Ch-15]|uniref:Prevent-host-death protein n=1 Tax=Chryseobacterium muglaense TaxID=2893752 RepID=A0A9Q3YUR9_9FLAO|nr:prevent-host-death protein [Chryseobacterium muglaense]MBD3905272.1 prevent-host-death protein [Chryseobacterium muglaense]MCC9033970.1 prevent-host-death protein [Chryseobacterium muglaense]MCM2554189.1 prevent-host-death protein [Chryseobacterium muglaense]
MNYKLELRTPDSQSKLIFHAITFDTFKVNIVERYGGVKPILCDVLFRVRTLDDQIIKRKDGHIKIRIKGEELEIYQRLLKVFKSYDYKNRLISRRDAEQDLVHFILRMVIINYEMN